MNGLGFDLIGMGIVLPVLLSFVLTGFIRFSLGQSRGRNFAVSAVGITYLVTYIVLFGWLPFPPIASGQKTAYLALFALIVGLLLDLSVGPESY